MDKIVVITGPTGVGKTRLGIEVAKYFNTDIINGDAYQIYQKMNIGTAKPTEEEQQSVKHHLVGVIDPLVNYSVYDYQQTVRSLISKMKNEDKLPVIVGGSGLYIDAVISNYQFEVEKRNIDAEEQYAKFDNQELHSLLASLDFDISAKIHPNNRKRVLRAINFITNKIPIENREKRHEKVFDTLLIFLNDDREKLYDRINSRVDKMILDGLIDEVKQLYPDALGRTAKQAIGYKELYSYLDGLSTLDEALDSIKKNSRHYAKRQLTWFRNRSDVHIVNINSHSFNITIKEVVDTIEKWLNK